MDSQQTQDSAMVREAQDLQVVLWQQTLKRLDGTGQRIFALYGLLFVYEKIVAGQLTPGPAMEIDEIRKSMKKTLDQARSELTALGLDTSVISPHVGDSGPGGIRTLDPHNAMG